MMMVADGHTIAQATKPQRRREIRHPLVAIRRIVAVTANRRGILVACWTMSVHASEGNLLASVRDCWNAPARSICHQLGRDICAHDWPPSALEGVAAVIPIR